MPELVLSDITLHYEVEGSGPPLVLLAGMLSDSATWAAVAPQLAQNFTVFRPDNRTTGRTIPWDAPAQINYVANDVMALMDHFGHDQFHVVGHSMGGLIALEIAGLFPSRVASATVMACGRVRNPRTNAVFDALLKIRRMPQGEEAWLRALYPWIFRPEFFSAQDSVDMALHAAQAYPHAQGVNAMALQIEALKAFQPQAALDQVTCPTLILYAGEDILVPPALARAGFAEIANKIELTVENAGHSIIWDAPKEVVVHLSGFLNAQPFK